MSPNWSHDVSFPETMGTQARSGEEGVGGDAGDCVLEISVCSRNFLTIHRIRR